MSTSEPDDHPTDQSAYPHPPHGPGYGFPPPLPPHPNAAKALALGLVALIGGFTCYLPILIGPFAWAVGRSTLREIDAEPGRWAGRDMASIGHITGIVATVLLGVMVLVAVGVGAVLLYSP